MFKKSKGTSILGLWMFFVMALSLLTAANVSAQGNPTIAVTAGAGGKITPDDDVLPVEVPSGTNKKFTITPNAYYHIDTVQAGPLGLAVSVYDSLTWNTTNKKIAYYKFVNVVENKEINATFALDRRKLTVSKGGLGTGLVTDDKAQIDCGLDCSGDYEYDIGGATWPSVALTATADDGARFQGWFDAAGALLSKTSPYTTKMNKNKKITAKFLKTYVLTTPTAGEGTGTVTTALVSGKSFGGGVYKAGSIVTIKAIPASGSNFTGWSGDVTSANKKISVTMNADKSVNATFSLVEGAKIPTKVNVVDAKSLTTSLKPGMQALRIGPLTGVPYPPPGSDYELDQTNVYVQESSAETFNTINEILCKIDQAKYAEMLNKGPYKAQIDKNLCSSGKDSASDAGQQSQNQSSGANMPDYELWTLDSLRENDSSPHIVKAWLHQESNGYDPDMLIYAKVVITKGMDEQNPYGLFSINFKGSPVMGGEIIPFTLMQGFMKTELDPVTNKVFLKFTSKFDTTTVPPAYGVPPMTWIDKATLNKKEDGTGSGTAYIYEYGDFGQGPAEDQVTFNFGFNADYFHKMEAGEPLTEMCLNRNDFDESVWSYGLYDSTTGMRINRNSGFSIKKTQGDKDYYGWIGYWGVWFPEEVTINNGDTVYKVTYGPGGTEEPYTVMKSGGKLKKYTLEPLTLLDIKNVPLDYTLGQGPQSTMYRVNWDGSNFTVLAKFDPMTGFWGPLEGGDPTTINLSSLSYDTLFLYSQALHGNVQVKLNYAGGCTPIPGSPPTFSCPATNSTPVNSYTEQVIYPSDTVPAQLACFGNCPDPVKMTSEDPFNHYDWEPQVGVLPPVSDHATYTFDTVNMVLMSGATPVIATNPAENFQWGIMSGPLFDPSNLSALECEMDPGNPASPDSTCGWKTWGDIPEYYVWETGPNSWNQFTALQGAPPFDPPLLVSYVHQWDPLVPLNTSTFYLEYSGFGNLNGIPGKCVDTDTGEEMPCGPDARWVPQFSIPEGSEVDDVVSATTYIVKPLEMEQRMKDTNNPGLCADIPLKSYSLPSLSDWADPNIGDEPVLEGPPAVIGGVLQ